MFKISTDILAYGWRFGLITMIPLRVLVLLAHRRFALGERRKDSMRIAIGMLPTLVFGLVIAEILRDRFAVSAGLYGGLIIYTIGCTLMPALLLKTPLEEYEAPHAPKLHVAYPGAAGEESGGGGA